MKTINITSFVTRKARLEPLAEFGIKSMFSVGADSKTIKGIKYGYNTAILYMSPNDSVCPAAKSAGCRDSCLVSAGRGSFNSVKRSRANKSALYAADTTLFYSALVHEIRALIRKYGDTLTIRLNGTSDIAHENQPLIVGGKRYHSIMALFPNVIFYDYTKRIQRARTTVCIPNYHITLSYSLARPGYASKVLSTAKRYGLNVAVVFKGSLPEFYKGFPVLGGDDSDLRFLDDSSKTNIIGLSAKGKAKKDTSGFVIHTKDIITIG